MLAALPPLRAVAAEHGLAARKSLGQHYLFDLNLTGKIVRLAGDLTRHAVIEVGPGPGGLTRALLMAGAGHVVAVEADARFLPALDQISAAAPGDLSVVRADARRVDEPTLLAELAPDRPAAVVSNLPYNVGTALLIKWLTADRWWDSLTLMFQKEVAERIVAKPGTAAYGRLAVLSALRAAPRLVLHAPARAFTPPPKVDSAVVHLTPPAGQGYADLDALERLTTAAFGQRRKMLRRSIKTYAAQHGLTVEGLCERAEISPEARPETLAPEAFARLATVWREAQ